jgi:hypothetical protein
MATGLRLFNSVGGYSVGETPANVILANSDITLGYAISSNTPGNANIYLSAATGNLYTYRILTDNLAHANGVAWNFLQAGGTTGQLQFNDGGALGGSSSLTFDSVTSNLTLAGNAILQNIYSNTTANVANLNTTGTVNFTSSANVTLGPIGNVHISGGSSGYVLQTNGSGALQWVSPSSVGIGGTNTQVEFNDAGSFGGSANFTFTKTTNTLAVDNVTLVATGNLTGGNLVSANYFTGTLTTGAQPNITSVGTLTTLTVTANANSGNIYTGNLSLTGAVITSLVPGTSNTYDLGNSTSAWRNVYVGSNIFIGGTTAYLRATGNVIKTDALQTANNANVGSLTVQGTGQINSDLTVSGNLTVGGATTYINVTTTTIKDPLLDIGGDNNGANIAAYDGKDRGFIFHNYYSNNSGAVNQAFVWNSGNSEFRAIADVLSVSGEVVTPNAYANIKAATFSGNVVATTIGGNLTTAAQPNITSVGSLSSLVVTGLANVNSLRASGLNYPTTDGSTGQFLKTDGSGTLSWATVSTSSISNGTSNVSVASSGNVTIAVAGSTIATISSGGANITGTLNVTSNITTANLSATVLTLGNSTQGSLTTTTTQAISRPIANIPYTSSIHGAELFVKGYDSAGTKYTIAKIHVVTDGANVDWDVFGGITLSGLGGSAGGSFAIGIVSGNIQLSVTPSSSNSTVWTTKYTTV